MTVNNAKFYDKVINGEYRAFYDENNGRDIYVLTVNDDWNTAWCEVCEIEYDEDFNEENEIITEQLFTIQELSHFERRA